MDFEKAKALLIENAVGQNNYEELTTWSELVDAADLKNSAPETGFYNSSVSTQQPTIKVDLPAGPKFRASH